MRILTTLCFVALTTLSVHAQTLKTPAPSPLQTIDQAFALSNIKIEYSRPSVKGRVIFGDLVPFGKIWRTGANSSTKITFGDDVKVEGTDVKAGSYAIYTIPNKDSWDIMLYKDATLGGNVADYKTENEVLRFKVTPTSMTSKTETFTINVGTITSNSARIELMWDKTYVSFAVTADIDSKIMKNIDAALEKDARPYFTAASYYYDNGKDLNKALDWATIAANANPKAYWISHLQAKIQLKMKDYKGAIATAEKSLAAAKEDQDATYVSNNEKLIAEAKAGK